MSHVASYRTEIKIPQVAGMNLEDNEAWRLLRSALEAVAAAHGGQVVEVITDSEGRRVRCDAAIVVPEFRRGLGVKVDQNTGQVKFLYDTWGGFAHTAKELSAEVVQNFTALAVTRALQEMNYEVDLDEVKVDDRREVWIRAEL